MNHASPSSGGSCRGYYSLAAGTVYDRANTQQKGSWLAVAAAAGVAAGSGGGRRGMRGEKGKAEAQKGVLGGVGDV
ncbi:hypothetical protein E2C01_070263 [Portunus trituberculatus]|uniref:Uncharacterized protein n=1 Tax=Portunus trituberculatus TaxID=210409 RepID=A0A5B7I1M9_PORTR|nr:hypothetical protein [Portunus trituberculatus]